MTEEIDKLAWIHIKEKQLLSTRSKGKEAYYLPGGKREPGESDAAALIRELKEELGIDVTASCLAPLTFASHAYEKFHLLMPLFVCRRWNGQIAAREGQALKWVRAVRLSDYPMPPADVPLIPVLRDLL